MAHKHIVYMMLADAAVRAGEEAAIRRYAAPLEQLATQDEHRPYLAAAHRAWGVAHRLAGELTEAEARLSQALELFEELGFSWQVGRTLVELAELELARSDPSRSAEHLSRALDLFEALQAQPDAERTRSALAALA